MKRIVILASYLQTHFCALSLIVCFCGITIGQASVEPTPPIQYPKEPPKLTPEQEKDFVTLPRDDEMFKYVESDRPFKLRGQIQSGAGYEKAAEMELKAYEYVAAFASKKDPGMMAKYSLRNVPIGNLYKPVHSDYLRDLIHIKGVLVKIMPMKPTENLEKMDKVGELFECWIYPEKSSYPVCLVVSQLPPGLEPSEKMYHQVDFDAYFFKLFHYESSENKNDGSDGGKWKKAPLFIGKSFNYLGKEPTPSSFNTSSVLFFGAGATILILVVVGIYMWYRRGDHKIRASTNQTLYGNTNFDNQDGLPGNNEVK